MARTPTTAKERMPREWRRRVSVRARVRHDGGWDDCHILNVSSRGMLLQYSRPLSVGSQIEVRQEGLLVPATVVWREGFRAGLSCTGPVPVDQWLSLPPNLPAFAPERNPRLAAMSVAAATPAEGRDLARRAQGLAIALGAALISLGFAVVAARELLLPLETLARTLG